MTDAELIEVFHREVAEALDDLALIIETLYAAEEGSQPEQLRAAFRIAHNIKGAARATGSSGIERLTHALEDVLGEFLTHERPTSQLLLDQMLSAVVVMEHALNGDAVDDDLDTVVATLSQLSEQDPEDEGQQVEPPTPTPAASEDSDDTGASARSTLRVEAYRLDRLMAHTGEFLAAASRSSAQVEHTEDLVASFRTTMASLPPVHRPKLAELLRQLEAHAQAERLERQRLSQLVDSFGESIKRVRMFPLRAMAKQWRAVVRSTAEATKKRVRLELSVGDIEIDKLVFDELRDPFTHLLRNAVDHGVEAPEVRRGLGKQEHGVITVQATLVGTNVWIEVIDDGGGLDRDTIARGAMQAGIVDEQGLAQMGEDEIFDLLFATGFTTTRAVSRISGRGLGLDVVRRRVEALAGDVEICPATAGPGTCVRLRVPATLVSTHGLLVRTHDNVYALPLDYVVRTLRVSASALEQVDGGAAIRVGEGEPLRVRWLSALLRERREVDPEQLVIVVISDGRGRIGVVVREVLGEAEFVAKRLPWNLGEVPGVTGVMTQADGSLAIVADIPHLIASAARERGHDDQQAIAAAPTQRSRILVVDDSLTSRTLERNILAAAGYEVAVTCDGEEAWQHLQAEVVDLVVADIEMPGLDGFELTRRIRASTSLSEVPVILVTSLDGAEDRAKGAAAGADEYVVKGSFDQQVLLEAVARLI